MQVDVAEFILAIEKRPGLYNTSLKEYADKNLKKILWLEVCEEFIENWTELGYKEKTEKCQELRKKWKNLRTCFEREYDAQKKGPSGSNATKRHKYLYFDQLSFLRDSVKCRKTSSSLEQNTIDESEDIDAEPSPNTDCIHRPSSKLIIQKHSTSRSYEESLLQFFIKQERDEEKEIDEDKYFLLSLLPAFKKFNEDQKFYARREIMNVMRRVRLSGSQNPTAKMNSNRLLLNEQLHNCFQHFHQCGN